MAETRPTTNINRISMVAAAILLSYSLAGFLQLPAGSIAIHLPGFYAALQINVQVAIVFLVTGMAATGTDWLVREHPSFKGRFTIQHWLLPALTAWGIGMLLLQQPYGLLWWMVYGVGGAVLIWVLTAEYMVVDPDDVRHVPATIGLTAISFALFLVLTVTIRAMETRLFILTPTITLAAALTSLRALHLRLHGQWAFIPAGVISLIIGQLCSALNYLPVGPIAFGLFLLGPAYALTSFIGGLLENKTWRQVAAEPITVLVIVWGIAASL